MKKRYALPTIEVLSLTQGLELNGSPEVEFTDIWD